MNRITLAPNVTRAKRSLKEAIGFPNDISLRKSRLAKDGDIWVAEMKVYYKHNKRYGADPVWIYTYPDGTAGWSAKFNPNPAKRDVNIKGKIAYLAATPTPLGLMDADEKFYVKLGIEAGLLRKGMLDGKVAIYATDLLEKWILDVEAS